MPRSDGAGGAPHVPRRTVAREPGICSWITRAVLQELDARGIPADGILARHHLSRAELEDPNAWISQRSHARFYRGAIGASGDPSFGVAVGRHVPIQITRVAGHCAAVSGNVREAMDVWGRFSALVVDFTHFGTRSTPEHDAIFWTRPPALIPLHEDGPSFAASVLGFLAQSIGPVTPVEVRLTGPAPSSGDSLSQALGAPVRFAAEHFEMRLRPGTLDTPLRFADPAIREMLVKAAQRELEMREGGSVTRRVRAAILHLGFDRSVQVHAIAEALGTTERTLQRWLGEESLTFSEVRSATLRDAAVEMLTETDATVADVAFRLGFTSRNAFHRAIRRWTGKTPGEFRNGPSPAGLHGNGGPERVRMLLG